MSRIRLIQVATPSSPASTKGELFYSSTLSPAALAFIDSSGNISRLGGLTTKDYRLVKVTTILQGTTSYTPTSGVSALFVECWGAGASGAGVAQATSSQITLAVGGGGGAYSASWVTTNVSGAHTSIIVGLGGAAPSAGANDGNSGTDTVFTDNAAATIIVAKAGVKGLTANGLATGTSAIITGLGGAGGSAASGTGDMKFGGGDGKWGIRSSGTVAVSGAGGDAGVGSPGGSSVASSANGGAGQTYGAGGAGAMDTGTAARAGGAGANGLIRVWEFA